MVVQTPGIRTTILAAAGQSAAAASCNWANLYGSYGVVSSNRLTLTVPPRDWVA
jgi:hypothetical protein